MAKKPIKQNPKFSTDGFSRNHPANQDTVKNVTMDKAVPSYAYKDENTPGVKKVRAENAAAIKKAQQEKAKRDSVIQSYKNKKVK